MTLTLGQIDSKTMLWLQQKAEQQGISTEDFIANLLKQYMKSKSSETLDGEYHDLDHLAGTWSKEDEKRVPFGYSILWRY